MITIAVDCMGGDHGPIVTLPACQKFLDRHPDVELLLVGLPGSLNGFSHARAKIIAASEVVGMDDPIEIALRQAGEELEDRLEGVFPERIAA